MRLASIKRLEADQSVFWKALERLRTGKSTDADVDYFLSLHTSKFSNVDARGSLLSTYMVSTACESASEDNGSDEGLAGDWLINVDLPNGESDLIIASASTPAMELYFDVISSAAEKLEVGVHDIRSLYAERHYAAHKCPIKDLGMYHCCTVTVDFLHDWNWKIIVDIPDGTSIKVHAEASMSPSELHDLVAERATDYLGVTPNEIYSLYRGKAYNMFDNVSLVDLGMHNGCSVTVYGRIRGGVCVANRVGGKRRGVSAFFRDARI